MACLIAQIAAQPSIYETSVHLVGKTDRNKL
jgi:hypothetical protein